MTTPQQEVPIPQYQYQQFTGVVYPDGQHMQQQQQQQQQYQTGPPQAYNYTPIQEQQQQPTPQPQQQQQQQQQFQQGYVQPQQQQGYVQPQQQQVVHEMQTVDPILERHSTMSPAITPAPGSMGLATPPVQAPGRINITPDPLPKALAAPAQQVSSVKPSPGATMTYQPKLNLPVHVEWQHGMCGWFGDFFRCKNMNTCCCGMWCPCILYSRVHYRLRARNPHDLNGFANCNGQCWNSACLGFAVHSRQRDEIRHRYGLPGSCMGDCARHACCCCCTLCQEEKEIVYREKELEELVKMNTYQNSQTMMYAPMPNQEKSGL